MKTWIAGNEIDGYHIWIDAPRGTLCNRPLDIKRTFFAFSGFPLSRVKCTACIKKHTQLLAEAWNNTTEDERFAHFDKICLNIIEQSEGND